MSAYHTMLSRISNGYEKLTLYELTFKVNDALLKGKEITSADREYIVKRFIDGTSSRETIERFHRGVNAPRAENGDNREMYPLFYIPPYDDGKKYVTISTITPKTQILSANSYELEILRILSIMARTHPRVSEMLDWTKKRLGTTCFGQFCAAGECFEASVVALRFLGTAYPKELEWMKKLINGFKNHVSDKKRHSGVKFYYWLTLSELPIEIAEPEIKNSKDDLLKMIKKSFVMNSDHDKYASPFGIYVIKNCLSRLEEYAYLNKREPYISEKDGRIHIDYSELILV